MFYLEDFDTILKDYKSKDECYKDFLREYIECEEYIGDVIKKHPEILDLKLTESDVDCSVSHYFFINHNILIGSPYKIAHKELEDVCNSGFLISNHGSEDTMLYFLNMAKQYKEVIPEIPKFIEKYEEILNRGNEYVTDYYWEHSGDDGMDYELYNIFK